MEYSAYVYGDAVMLTRIMSQIAMIFDGSAFVTALKVAALMGVIVAFLSGILRGGQMTPSTFFWPLIIPVLLITPKVDLVIEDTKGTLSRVDDLPVGFAAPVTIITSVGAGISRMMTENLGLDTNLVSMDNGHLLSIRAPIVFEQIITNPEFQGEAAQLPNGLSPTKDVVTYLDRCLSWQSKQTGAAYKLTALQNRQLTDLRVDFAAHTVGGTNGTVYECGALYDALVDGLGSPEYQTRLNNSVNKYFSKSLNDTTTGGRYQAAMETLTPNPGDFYALVAFSNGLRMAPNHVTQAAGGGSHQAALQDALNQKREKNFGTAAMIFETISQTIAFTEAWSFSLIPLVILLLMAGPFGAKTAVRYFWMLVWIQLWYPTILFTIGYLDAWMDTVSIGSFTTIAGYNSFMAELARMQDVGYMNLSMATGLSMMLVFGTSSALGAAMQRDMLGTDHYDPKKNMPDTLSRAPHYSYAATMTHSKAGGYLGTDAKESFAGVTFSYDTARSNAIDYSTAKSIAAGASMSSGKTTNDRSGFGTLYSAGENFTAADRMSVGRTAASTLSFGTGLQQGGVGGANTTQTDTYGSINAVGANASLNGGVAAGKELSFGGGNKGNARGPDDTLGAGDAGDSGTGNNGAGAKAGLNGALTASTGASHTTAATQGLSSAYHMGVALDTRTGDSATASSGEQHTEDKSLSSGVTDTYHLGKDVVETATAGASINRTNTDTETDRVTESISKHAGRQYDGFRIANYVGNSPRDMRMMDELINSSPEVAAAVNNMLERDQDKFAATFGPGTENYEERSRAFAGFFVMQGRMGNLFPNDPNGAQRMEMYNALSDELMFNTGFGSGISPRAGASAEELKAMSPPSIQDVAASYDSRAKGFEITEAAAKSAATRTPVGVDGEETLNRYTQELGMDLEKMTGGQINGMFSAYREHMDSKRSKMDSDTENFMDMYRDLGLTDAVKNNFWISSANDLRREAVYDSYDRAKSMWIDNNSLDDREAQVDHMVGTRMKEFQAAGVSTEDGPVAKYMALTQLEAGAIDRGDAVEANILSQRRNEMIENDPVLAHEDTAARIEAFALTGASQEAVFDAHTHSQSEYVFGQMGIAAGRRSGFEIRSDGEGVSWGQEVNRPVQLQMGDVGEHHTPISISPHDRDIAIRTVIGEAASESDLGQAAVAHVIRTRLEAGGYGNTVADVSLADKQFSAWNDGAGGNHLVTKYGPGSAQYERTGKIVDAVFNGAIADPTNRATNYYSPAGMRKLVADGDQTNELPRWLEEKERESGGRTIIGGHIFVGRG